MPLITGTFNADDVQFAAVQEHAAGRGLTVRQIADSAVSERVKSITADFEQSLDRLVPLAYRKATVQEKVDLIAQLKAIAER
jgi:hypothetical protein